MTPEIKAAITYFLLFLIAGCGMIIQGFNLKKTKMDSPVETADSKKQNGQFLIVVGGLIIVWQAYELYQKLV